MLQRIPAFTQKDITLPPERIHILRNSINAETDTPCRSRSRGSGALSGCAGKRERTGDTHRCHVAAKGTRLRLRISGMGNPDYLDMLRRRATQRDVMENIDWNSKTASTQEACAEAHFGVVPSTDTEACSLKACGSWQPPARRWQHQRRSERISRERAQLPSRGSRRCRIPLAEAMRTLALDSTLRTRLGQRRRMMIIHAIFHGIIHRLSQ